MQAKRLTLFAGHYGSGKTNIAINYALHLKQQGKDVLVADLDIVNPYFRTKDSQDLLAQQGIELLSSPYANSNVDLPSIPQQMYAVIDDKSRFAVLDVGGDDRGAMALGRYAPGILEENQFELLLVINSYRPLAKDPQDAFAILRDIERAAGLRVTALVNNSNLGAQTTQQTVLDSLDYAEQMASLAGVPVKMTTVREDLYPALSGKIPNLMPLTLQQRNFF